jgi:dinuclear metal center YbgI/SA1388 family protein
MKTEALLGELDRLAPFQLAEPWDKVGLQVGSAAAEVRRVLVVLDVTEAALEEAARLGCEAIVAHHPLLFDSLAAVTDESHAGRTVLRAARDGRVIVVAHTNLDKARGGLADIAAGMLELEAVEPLEVARMDWFKLVGFVPVDEVDDVRTAVFAAGAGVIGDYEHCSFMQPGTGTFLPGQGASPTVGKVGKDNSTREVRLEIVFPRAARRRVIDAYLAAHSYEEPAFDVYPVEDELARAGLGRVGYLPQPLLLRELAALVAHLFKLPWVRYTGDPGRRVQRVALVPGSGAALIQAAATRADVLVTGDVKHHDADRAAHLGLALVDLPHDAAEGCALERWADRLSDGLGRHRVQVEFLAEHRRLWRHSEPVAAPTHLGVDDMEPDTTDGEYVLFVDGGSRGNPGPAGIGARLETDEGELAEELADYIGVATNNVAEYQAVIAGLELALDHGARKLVVYADSELVVKQLNGEYRVKELALRTLHEQATRLLREVPDAEVKHIPREQNADADRLVNQAIDEAKRRA